MGKRVVVLVYQAEEYDGFAGLRDLTSASNSEVVKFHVEVPQKRVIALFSADDVVIDEECGNIVYENQKYFINMIRESMATNPDGKFHPKRDFYGGRLCE